MGNRIAGEPGEKGKAQQERCSGRSTEATGRKCCLKGRTGGRADDQTRSDHVTRENARPPC